MFIVRYSDSVLIAHRAARIPVERNDSRVKKPGRKKNRKRKGTRGKMWSLKPHDADTYLSREKPATSYEGGSHNFTKVITTDNAQM